jgi:hypothetical protein
MSERVMNRSIKNEDIQILTGERNPECIDMKKTGRITLKEFQKQAKRVMLRMRSQRILKI